MGLQRVEHDWATELIELMPQLHFFHLRGLDGLYALNAFSVIFSIIWTPETISFYHDVKSMCYIFHLKASQLLF